MQCWFSLSDPLDIGTLNMKLSFGIVLFKKNEAPGWLPPPKYDSLMWGLHQPVHPLTFLHVMKDGVACQPPGFFWGVVFCTIHK